MDDDCIYWPYAKSPDEMLEEKDAEIKRLQAQVDALMLEFCPDEMTHEQVARWGENQKPALEAAMRKPVGEVGYSWTRSTTSQSATHAYPLTLLSDQHIPPGTKLYAFPPDAARLKEEGDAWGRELVVRNRELTDAQAEIERLQAQVNDLMVEMTPIQLQCWVERQKHKESE